jgi:hypothetical protein
MALEYSRGSLMQGKCWNLRMGLRWRTWKSSVAWWRLHWRKAQWYGLGQWVHWRNWRKRNNKTSSI